MATHSVTVLTVHGCRQTVKVEPNMTMLEILETVCRKYKFAHDEYDLLHHYMVLDLTTMFRFAGIPNNALLKMAKAKQIRTEKKVIVQLQLEDGTRSENGTFDPSQTLFDVLMALCPARATAESHPVLVYMRREVYWEQLTSTTLRSLGLIRGRAAFRLLQRRAEEPKTPANVSAPLPQTVRREEPAKPVTTVPLSEAPTAAVAASLLEAANTSASVPEPTVEPAPERIEETKASEVVVEPPQKVNEPSQDVISEQQLDQQQTDTPRPEQRIIIVGGRAAMLFHASTAERDQEEVTDSFFDLSTLEMMEKYKQLQDRVKPLEDASLLTGKLRDLLSTDHYRQAVIRVQFRDRHILQGVFKANETIGHVMAFVHDYLTDTEQSFYLYTTPSKVILQPTVSLFDVGCFPQLLLHFSYNHAANDGTIASARFCPLRPDLLRFLSNATGASDVAARIKRNAISSMQEIIACSTLETIASSTLEISVSTTQESTAASSADYYADYYDDSMPGPSNRIPHRNFQQSLFAMNRSVSEWKGGYLSF